MKEHSQRVTQHSNDGESLFKDGARIWRGPAGTGRQISELWLQQWSWQRGYESDVYWHDRGNGGTGGNDRGNDGSSSASSASSE